MKKIRYNIFETNSSSTHAIVVPKQIDEEEYSLEDSLDHDYGFGRQECRLVESWDEKLAYCYLILQNMMEWTESNNTWKPKHQVHKSDLDKFLEMIKEIWQDFMNDNVKRYPSYNPQDIIKYLDSDRDDGDITGNDSFHVLMERYGKYVDHANGLDDTDFIDRLLNDKNFVKKLIFNKNSYITIGGDEYRGYNIKTIGFEYDYKDGDMINNKGELPPKEWYNKNGIMKDKYWKQYIKEYTIDNGEFWCKLREYEKDNDVYLKGN